MKKLFLLGLLGASIVLSNCGKDDGPTELINEILYGGSTYEIENGYILEYGENNGLYQWTIIITDGSYDDYTGEIGGGTTYAYYGQLYSTTNDLVGTYPFVAPGTTTSETRFFSSSEIDIDLMTPGGLSVTDGEIEINGDGPAYTFDVTATIGGQTLRGKFDGTFSVEPGATNEDVLDNGTSTFEFDLEHGSIWEQGNIQRANGNPESVFWVTLTQTEFDQTSECAPNEKIEIRISTTTGTLDEGVYVSTQAAREDGTAAAGSFDYANGNHSGQYWNSFEGTVTVTSGGTNRYLISWEIDVYTGQNGRTNGGPPNGTVSGNFKGEYSVSASYYCL